MRPGRHALIAPFLTLSALLFAAPAEASLTRATSPAIDAREAPAITLSAPASEPSEFSLFEGTELAVAAAEPSSAERFHPLAALSLLSKDGAEPRLVSADELSYPKTRYRVFELLGTPILGVERGVSLELRWGSGEFRAGLASGTVGWLSQDPLGDVDSPNLYGFVGMRPHEKTDPLGLIELPEGPLTTSYSAAASEALNPGNPTAERMAFGILGLLVAPAAGVEQAIHGFLATPERLNRNVPAVVRETKAAMAATDTDTRLRHGAAALGAGSSVVLDVSIVAGLAKSAASATIERELAESLRVPPVSSAVPSSPAVRATTWQEYEAGVRSQYGSTTFTQRQYQAIVDGKVMNGVADSVIPDANAAVEAKFVGNEGWANSIRNPASPIGQAPFAQAEQARVLEQAQKYSAVFDRVIYHSNDLGLIGHYSAAFEKFGLKNVEFIHTPAIP